MGAKTGAVTAVQRTSWPKARLRAASLDGFTLHAASAKPPLGGPAQAGSTPRVERRCCATSCVLRLRKSEWSLDAPRGTRIGSIGLETSGVDPMAT